jgi:hypothetical protein
MGLTLRKIVNRPLSAAELDANFEYLASSAVSREEVQAMTIQNSVYAQTASYHQGNAENANYATTAGHALTADTAQYVASVDNITGGQESYLAVWNSNTTLTTGSIQDTGNSIEIGADVNLAKKLDVKDTATFSDILVSDNIALGLISDIATLTTTKKLKLQSSLPIGTKVFLGTEGTNSSIDMTELEVGLGDYARINGNVSVLKLTGRLLHSNGDTNITFLNVNPTLEHRDLDYTGKVVGISYSPTQVSIPRGTHIAFENTIGSNCFNTQGGNTAIGTAESEGYKLNVSGSTKISSILNLVPLATLPLNATAGDVAMSGSAVSVRLCYYNGTEWVTL